jgi:hypothetical protein
MKGARESVTNGMRRDEAGYAGMGILYNDDIVDNNLKSRAERETLQK